MSTIRWRKSSHSDTQGNVCVEVARLPDGVAVRDSKKPTAPHITLSTPSFAKLIKDLKTS